MGRGWKSLSPYNLLQQYNMNLVILVATLLVTVTQGKNTDINWIIQSVNKCVSKGDTVTFKWSGTNHNVEKVTKDVYDSCDGITETEGSPGPFTFKAEKKGTFYFVCGVEGHCDGGQKAKIEVKDKC